MLCLLSPAADIDAGKERSAACSACHGANGISVKSSVPNLAGQKADYLAAQLKAFRSGQRNNDFMNAMAGSLSDQDIDNLAAFFGSLDGDVAESVSPLSAVLNTPRIQFPEGYRDTFTFYTTVNRPDNKQVRYLYASPEALENAKQTGELPNGSAIVMEIYKAKLKADGTPVVGEDGFYLKDSLAAYAVMEKQAGWGDNVPAALRNHDWNYALFTAAKKHKAGVNQAECLACHKPLSQDNYLFSYQALRARAAK